MPRWIWLALVAVGLLAGGGVVWYYNSNGDEVVQLKGDDPRILVYTDDAQAPLGLGVAMPVVFDSESRCLYVADRQGDLHTAVWPASSEPVFHNGQRGVSVSGVGDLMAGDSVVDASVSVTPINPETYVGPPLLELGECLSSSGSAVVFYEITEVLPGQHD